jgi:hypothetical protein
VPQGCLSQPTVHVHSLSWWFYPISRIVPSTSWWCYSIHFQPGRSPKPQPHETCESQYNPNSIPYLPTMQQILQWSDFRQQQLAFPIVLIKKIVPWLLFPGSCTKFVNKSHWLCLHKTLRIWPLLSPPLLLLTLAGFCHYPLSSNRSPRLYSVYPIEQLNETFHSMPYQFTAFHLVKIKNYTVLPNLSPHLWSRCDPEQCSRYRKSLGVC